MRLSKGAIVDFWEAEPHNSQAGGMISVKRSFRANRYYTPAPERWNEWLSLLRHECRKSRYATESRRFWGYSFSLPFQLNG